MRVVHLDYFTKGEPYRKELIEKFIDKHQNQLQTTYLLQCSIAQEQERWEVSCFLIHESNYTPL